ncbi:MAG: SCO family protein [Candidatus Limnocylindrales bacterium]
MSVALMALVALSGIRAGLVSGPVGPSASATASPGPGTVVYEPARSAPELSLTDQAGRPFSLAQLAGKPALVFFGYTHCPDVCPATMGILTKVLADAGDAGLTVVFVTVDPERDTVAWMAEYVRYLPAGFTALTGSIEQIRGAANAWGVRYARVDTETSGEYSMSHTADVYLVDAVGMLRAVFPFGASEQDILTTMRDLAAAPLPTTAATAPATARPTRDPSAAGGPTVADLRVEVVSSSSWAGGRSPLILALGDDAGRLAEVDGPVLVQLTGRGGAPEGPPVPAVAVRPAGVEEVSFVAYLDIPTPGPWSLTVTATDGGFTHIGSGTLFALDQGGSARLGSAAPRTRTPTLADVGGAALRISTDPVPDLVMSLTSTADAISDGKPFVLVVDSARFKVTISCGKALALAKFLVDRWPAMTFIHLEPYAYRVDQDTPVLQGSLEAPALVPAAEAWGVGSPPWGLGSMPWVFVVDGSGTVVAKYQGVVGSADLDVIISMLSVGG